MAGVNRRGNEESDAAMAAHWAVARDLEWPLGPQALARGVMGREPDRHDRVAAAGWIKRWIAEGRVVRLGWGQYALTTEPERARILERRSAAGDTPLWARRWKVALNLGQPLTAPVLARALLGREPTDRERLKAARWLSRWRKEGRLVRVEPGVYVPPGSEAERRWHERKAPVAPGLQRAARIWEAHWEFAQSLGWPLTVQRLADAHYGRETGEAQWAVVRTWLQRWVREGRLERVGGEYGPMGGGLVARERKRREATWNWAQTLAWPLTAADLAHALAGGPPGDRHRGEAVRWLRRWVREGRVAQEGVRYRLAESRGLPDA